MKESYDVKLFRKQYRTIAYQEYFKGNISKSQYKFHKWKSKRMVIYLLIEEAPDEILDFEEKEHLKLKFLNHSPLRSKFKQQKYTIFMQANHFIKRVLDKKYRTLIAAGYMNNDLTLTEDGQEALTALVFDSLKDALVKEAEEQIKEIKEK